MDVKDSVVVKEAMDAVHSLINNTQIRTSLQPELLESVLKTSVDCPEKPENFELNVKRWNNQFLQDEICLTSGGADSTIAWFLAGKPKAIYIDLWQSYSWKEQEALQKIGISYKLIDLKNVQLNTDFKADWKHIIPGRNFLFLTVAAEIVKDYGSIHFACLEGEGFDSGKGDKSLAFIEQWDKWYRSITGKYITVKVLAQNTKPGWLREFASQGFDINIIRHKTVTCFHNVHNQCGECQACLRKYLSFISAFGLDTAEDYHVHPMVGCKEYIGKYNIKLNVALNEQDFTHYSERRCHEDLEALKVGQLNLMRVK